MNNVNLIIDKPLSAEWNMALDEWLITNKKPTLRFYSWLKPTISLGYFQKSEEVDIQYIKDKNYQLVRRLTGGKAVFHNQEITYSVTSPTEWFPGNLINSYKMIGQALKNGLSELGIESQLVERKPERLEGGDCFQAASWFEITANNKKLVGSAQTRKKGWLLQHGSILLNINESDFKHIFRHDDFFDMNYISISDLLQRLPSNDIIIEKLQNGFSEQLDWDFTAYTLSSEEKESVENLAERYKSDKWVLAR